MAKMSSLSHVHAHASTVLFAMVQNLTWCRGMSRKTLPIQPNLHPDCHVDFYSTGSLSLKTRYIGTIREEKNHRMWCRNSMYQYHPRENPKECNDLWHGQRAVMGCCSTAVARSIRGFLGPFERDAPSQRPGVKCYTIYTGKCVHNTFASQWLIMPWIDPHTKYIIKYIILK